MRAATSSIPLLGALGALDIAWRALQRPRGHPDARAVPACWCRSTGHGRAISISAMHRQCGCPPRRTCYGRQPLRENAAIAFTRSGVCRRCTRRLRPGSYQMLRHEVDAAAHVVRLAGCRIRWPFVHKPMLWILHLSYAWFPELASRCSRAGRRAPFRQQPRRTQFAAARPGRRHHRHDRDEWRSAISVEARRAASAELKTAFADVLLHADRRT